MKVAIPLPPAGSYPIEGTNHTRKNVALVLITKVVFVIDWQQLLVRAGSNSKVTPRRAYICNVPDITLYVLSAGHATASMLPVRVASDPVRS